MLESIVGGLLLALISGLTFIAYRHPRGYRRILSVLLPLLLMLALGDVAWRAGSISASLEYLDRGTRSSPVIKLSDVSETIQAMQKDWGQVGTDLAISGGAIAYLLFLVFLPQIVELRHEQGKEEVVRPGDVKQST
jgi:hypothetical protein